MEGKGKPNMAEREFETMADEFYKTASMNLYNNMKRTYDEYQGVSLDHQRNLNHLSAQALQNAVETANMVGKQAVRHGDIAIDHQWNVDEQSWAVTALMGSNVFKEAVEAAAAAAVAKALADSE